MTDVMEADAGARAFAVDVVATLNDQIAGNCALAARPEAVRRRRLRMIGAILLMPVIGFAGGFIAANLQDPAEPSLVAVLGDFSAAEWWNAAALLLAACGSTALAVLLLQHLNRLVLRWRVRHILLQRPWIDPHDPELREPVRAIFDADGYTARSNGSTTSVTWPFVSGIDDEDGLLILRVGGKRGFILPKRDLSAEQIEAIRAFVDAHAGIRPDQPGRPFVSPWQQDAR